MSAERHTSGGISENPHCNKLTNSNTNKTLNDKITDLVHNETGEVGKNGRTKESENQHRKRKNGLGKLFIAFVFSTSCSFTDSSGCNFNATLDIICCKIDLVRDARKRFFLTECTQTDTKLYLRNIKTKL